MRTLRLPIFVLSLIALVVVVSYYLFKRDSTTPVSDAEIKPVAQASVSTDSKVENHETATPVASEIPLITPEIKVLDEIFLSKNDNDPRMDTVLKNLNPAAKAALRKKYNDTRMEMRNERGTIAFLIGREVRDGRGTKEDVEFLKNVLMEKPCMSLSDCSKPNQGGGPEEQHLEAIHETTAHYPQLMALRYHKQALESGNLTPEMRASVISALESARHSPNGRVAQEAQSILDSLQPR